jgi:outer membrane immunogenic protein
MNWVSTVTGRLGYANSNWLFFAKGGWAWAGFSGVTTTSTPAGAPVDTSTASSRRDGWTLGAGLEWGFAAPWSAKLEYDYVNFNTATYAITEVNATTGAVTFPTRSTTSYLNMVKADVAYRF